MRSFSKLVASPGLVVPWRRRMQDSPPAQAEEAAGTSSDMDAEAAGESSSPGGSASPSERAAAARSSELGKYLDQAVQRMLAVGPQAFFATEVGAALAG